MTPSEWADERVTRTPIFRKDLGNPNFEAETYNSPAFPTSLLQNVPILNSLIKPFTHININSQIPLQSGTIRHEAIHALLGDAHIDYNKLAAANPYYQHLAQAFQDKRLMGDAPAEIPAYMTTPQDLGQAGLDYGTRAKNNIIQQLLKLDPSIGKKYQRLVQPQIPMPQ